MKPRKRKRTDNRRLTPQKGAQRIDEILDLLLARYQAAYPHLKIIVLEGESAGR